jgi:uncharacterized cupredoxin-like copper-binding protein
MAALTSPISFVARVTHSPLLGVAFGATGKSAQFPAPPRQALCGQTYAST